MLEKQALDTRRRLNTEIAPNTETDRNKQLLNMDGSGIRQILDATY